MHSLLQATYFYVTSPVIVHRILDIPQHFQSTVVTQTWLMRVNRSERSNL